VLEHTVKLSDVSDPTFYDAIFVPGGHGPMYDLAESDLLGDILTKAAAAGELNNSMYPNHLIVYYASSPMHVSQVSVWTAVC
jgi:hypothetical protein